jgi:inner membrane protein
MLIAHLPAGYLLTTAIQDRLGDRSRAVLATGLVASVLPDLDLLWFYFADGRQTMHHEFVTHAPLVWVAVAAVAWAVAHSLRIRGAGVLIGVALANLLLHCALDSVVGRIRWLWPLSDLETTLITIPARYDWWVWSFVLHPYFLLELAIIAAAGVVLWRRTRNPRPA